MPQYGILRFEKHKATPAGALEAHHERKKEKYASNPDVDIERSKYNFHIVKPTDTYRHEIDGRIKATGCRTRKDSTMFVDTLITASPDFFKGRKSEEIRAYFELAVDFMEKKLGKGNIFSAVVHMDEKTPHLHLCFTPITEDGRLCAKEILGNRAQLSKWQDEFHVYMVKGYPDLERGESSRKTGRQHIPTWVYKQAVHLDKQAERISGLLAEVNPLNAKKKTEEVTTLLHKFIPDYEKFASVLKKYRVGMADLKTENIVLKKEVDSGKNVKKQLDTAKLESDYADLRRFVNSIPADIRRQIEQQQRGKVNTKTQGR